ncbi:MAG TPA: hypothetical protein VLM89_17800 [Phycisphaerae bacterium]|nr:hypothetical protein [Phycisphaerae bacterium]
MACSHSHGCFGLGRRELLKAAGMAAAGWAARGSSVLAAATTAPAGAAKGVATVRAAFLYPNVA